MSNNRRDNRQEQELRTIIDTIPGNDKCADCENPNPRWASYSLGVFLCTRCASIHRKNSDMSKVKSISLDSWQTDQIRTMREIGNTISNYKYNPLREWPLQDDDQTMERFIKDKYERKRFMSQRETANFTPVKSAMKGSSVPVSPAQSSSAVIKYSNELDTLREMGFTDRARNIEVLKSVNGDVASATDVLVAMESTDGKSPPKKPERPRVRFTEDTIGGLENSIDSSANPFDMFAGNAGPSQGLSTPNPFSSIPPSMYHQQQQGAPFMGFDPSGSDPSQQQYMQPVAPLRQQLTGGQPLRPQLQQAPPMPSQAPIQHQLTGRNPPEQLFGGQTPNQYSQQTQETQTPQPFQSNIFGQENPYTMNPTPPRPVSAQPNTTFNVGAGLRPAFKPTVDLNKPFGNISSMGPQSQPQGQSPQTTGIAQQSHVAVQSSGPFSQNNQSFGQQNPGNLFTPGSAVQKPSSDPFGANFTSPLRAELTGIQQQSTGYNQNASNPAMPQMPQGVVNQFNHISGFNHVNALSPQASGTPQSMSGQQPSSGSYGSKPPLPNRLHQQNTGGQGFSTQPPTGNLYQQNTGGQALANQFVQPSTNRLYQQNTGSQGFTTQNLPGSLYQQDSGSQGFSTQGPTSRLSQQNTGGQGFSTQIPMNSLYAQNTGGQGFANQSQPLNFFSPQAGNQGGSFQASLNQPYNQSNGDQSFSQTQQRPQSQISPQISSNQHLQQNTGGQGLATTIQQPFSPQQSGAYQPAQQQVPNGLNYSNSPAPFMNQGGLSQIFPQKQQQRPEYPNPQFLSAQNTGFQPQRTGVGGMAMSKPFDKSSILSLYGGQPNGSGMNSAAFQQQQQQQQQQQPNMYNQQQQQQAPYGYAQQAHLGAAGGGGGAGASGTGGYQFQQPQNTGYGNYR